MTTARARPAPSTLAHEPTLLRAQLARLRRRLRWQLTLESLLDVALAVVAIGAVLVLLDWTFRFGPMPRAALLNLSALVAVPVLFRRIDRRWRAAQLDDLSLAVTLDRFRPGTGGRIADVLQLPDLLAEPIEAVSPAMVRLAVSQARTALEQSDWATLWNRRRTLRRLGGLLGVLLVPVVFALVAPAVARLSVARWLLGSNERWPQQTYLSLPELVARGRLLAPRDEPYTLEIRADLPNLDEHNGRWWVRGRGAALALRSRPASPVVPDTVRVRERTRRGTRRDAIVTATGPALFRHEVPPASGPTTIDLTGGDDWLGPITIDRADRPALAATRFRVHEPGTPAGSMRTVDEGLQHPVFLPDTEIELTLVGTEPLAEARLTVHPGQPPPLTRVDSRTFLARWTLREALTIEIQLTSSGTGLTSKPAFLSVGLQKDHEPRVVLRALGVGAHVTPVATIPLSIGATDDMGLAAVRLKMSRATPGAEGAEPKTTEKVMPLPLGAEAGRNVLDHQARHDIELQAEPPALGTVLRFVGEAEDRCARGAQVGRSTAVQMQVVPPDELFYEILTRQRSERARFLAVVEAAQKRTPTFAGTPPREVYAAASRALHSESRQLDMIAGRIADTLQEMKLNKVGSPKSHRLLQEGVIDPIRALETGPVAELRAALLSLAGNGPRTGADPESARRLHAAVVTKLETILEQMSQWESFVDVVNQVAEVIKMQQNVLDATEKARDARTREVFDEKPQ